MYITYAQYILIYTYKTTYILILSFLHIVFCLIFVIKEYTSIRDWKIETEIIYYMRKKVVYVSYNKKRKRMILKSKQLIQTKAIHLYCT